MAQRTPPVHVGPETHADLVFLRRELSARLSRDFSMGEVVALLIASNRPEPVPEATDTIRELLRKGLT